MNTANIDALGTKLANAAMTVLVRTARAQVAAASTDELEAACVAMRAISSKVVDQLLDDVREAPWIAQAAFQAAALELAQAGIAALRRG
jgi:hypothetical protein